ncbi:MAG: thiol oxidoreductase, partial [Pseudomonadota bacterium]
MTSFSTHSLIVLLGLLPFQAHAAANLADIHLKVVPRTAEELTRIETVTRPTIDFSEAERFETNQAGAATVRVRNSNDAFSYPSANIDFDSKLDFKVGNGLVKKLWVSSPSSTLASDGL